MSESELEEARRRLAEAEERVQSEETESRTKPRIRAQVVDLESLPRVDLNEVLASYDPVSVGTEMGREYIVVAPKSDSPMEPETGAPRKYFRDQNAVAEYHEEVIRAYDEEIGRQLALRDFAVPQEKGPKRIGIGGESGQTRPHDRVNFEHGVGIAGDADLTAELGTAVASPWTSWTRREYNADLFGLKGLRVYDKMRKSDGTVRGTLRLAKTPVLAAQWSMKPASRSTRDINIANFVWNNLQTWMSMSWPQFVHEALLMLDFGYYMFEVVFAHGEDVTADPTAKGKMVWKKFAPRHPMDVKEWFFDLNGGPLSVDMWAPPVQVADTSPGSNSYATGSGPSVGKSLRTRTRNNSSVNGLPPTFEGGVIQAFQRWINIPINKLVVFSFDKEAGNIEGISLLRSAYKHWFYKDNLYKIDAIQKERHGIGIPVIQLPVGYSQDDKNLADQLGRNLRTNERAHVVLPPAWILEFAELKGHPVDCIPSIKHHDAMIPQSILGQFMVTEKTDVTEQHTIFLQSTRSIADVIVDVINKYAIPQLVQMNWGRNVYPQLVAKRIGEEEFWRTSSFTLRNYVGAGIIVPDDAMENQIREEMGLPPVDTATARIVRSPALENPQKIQPAPTEEAGPGHQVIPANLPGQPATPNEPPAAQPSQPESIEGIQGPMPAVPPVAGAQQTRGPGSGQQEKQNARTPGPTPSPQQTPQKPQAIVRPGQPLPPQAGGTGMPRQKPPHVIPPGVGKPERSGDPKSKRRGQ